MTALPEARLVEKVGLALYGKQWQTDLARDLGVAPRTVRHWVQTGAIPAQKWQRIEALGRLRIDRLSEALSEIPVS